MNSEKDIPKQVIRSGLVSITFRKLSPAHIIDLVSRAGLDGIEWGGDVHVPPGQVEIAREVKSLCIQAGIATPSYGSYYHAGHDAPADFDGVLECAAVLDVKTIRIWAGRRSPDEADEVYWNNVVIDTRRVADMAGEKGITVSYEFHAKTLTETNETTRRLIAEVGHPNLRCYWQPSVGFGQPACLEGLQIIGKNLSNLHVFYWQPDHERQLLAEGRERWRPFLQAAAAVSTDTPRYVLIEFVKNDEPENFFADAETLKAWLMEQVQ